MCDCLKQEFKQEQIKTKAYRDLASPIPLALSFKGSSRFIKSFCYGPGSASKIDPLPSLQAFYYVSLVSSMQVQTTTMCISVSLSGFVVLGCLFAPKVHIVLFQPQKNVVTHRLHLNRFSVSGTGTTCSQGN